MTRTFRYMPFNLISLSVYTKLKVKTDVMPFVSLCENNFAVDSPRQGDKWIACWALKRGVWERLHGNKREDFLYFISDTYSNKRGGSVEYLMLFGVGQVPSDSDELLQVLGGVKRD